ncbi:MAG: glycosyltransferase, partial [Candidatus Heimdallarchaeota archaeon]|nr:glycosyltransferase [Candidatus Heimdallarchaeota archaeon]
MLPSVSIIIPFYNNIEQVTLCLKCIQDQSYPKEKIEVIIINNGCKKQKINHVAVKYEVIYMYHGTPGSYAARNCGILNAKGPILAFTDSDCRPEPDWLEKGISCLLSEKKNTIIGGHIEVVSENITCPNAIEQYEKITAHQQERYIKDLEFAATANLFTWIDTFQQVGMFDELLKSGGDREWGNRAADQGYNLKYCPESIILHPGRENIKQLFDREARLAGGIYQQFLQTEPSVYETILWWLPRITPPIQRMADAIRNPQLSSISNKLKIASLIALTKYISLFEIMRIRFGG